LSFKHRVRCITLCLGLWIGAGLGGPMPPEQIQERFAKMTKPAIAHVLRAEDEDDEDLT
jgi:hypothetical protein